MLEEGRLKNLYFLLLLGIPMVPPPLFVEAIYEGPQSKVTSNIDLDDYKSNSHHITYNC